MPAGVAGRKAVSGFSYFHLSDPIDFIALMAQLFVINWSATLRSFKDPGGVASWDMHIVNDNAEAQYLSEQDRVKVLHLGDVAVYDPVSGKITTMRIEEFNSNYTIEG